MSESTNQPHGWPWYRGSLSLPLLSLSLSLSPSLSLSLSLSLSISPHHHLPRLSTFRSPLSIFLSLPSPQTLSPSSLFPLSTCTPFPLFLPSLSLPPSRPSLPSTPSPPSLPFSVHLPPRSLPPLPTPLPHPSGVFPLYLFASVSSPLFPLHPLYSSFPPRSPPHPLHPPISLPPPTSRQTLAECGPLSLPGEAVEQLSGTACSAARRRSIIEIVMKRPFYARL